MKKKFFKNLLFLITLNLLVKPFWVFGVDRVVQNIVGSAEYGIYFSLFNLSILFNIILDFGLTNFNNRNIAQHKQLLPKYFSNIVVLKFLLAIVYAVITISVGLFAGYDFERFKILFLLIFNQFLLSVILYLRSNISGLHLFKVDSLISVLDRLLMIFIIGFLLLANFSKTDFNIKMFVFSQTAAYFITALIAFVFVLKKANSFSLKINKAFLISTIKQTLPFAVLVFFMSFYNRLDAVLLERFLPDGEIQAGIYAQSFRLLDALSQFALLFANLLLPIFARMIQQKENVSDLVGFSFFLILIPSVIFSVSSFFYNYEIISFLYKDHNEFSSSVFAVLIFTFIPVSINYIFGTLMTANGNLKHLNIIAVAGLVLNLTLNFLLIPVLFAKGSAVAALATQFLVAVLQMGFSIYFFKIKFSLKKILSIIVFLVIYLVMTFFIHKYIKIWFLGFLLSMFLGFILAFFLKLLSIKIFVRLLKGHEN